MERTSTLQITSPMLPTQAAVPSRPTAHAQLLTQSRSHSSSTRLFGILVNSTTGTNGPQMVPNHSFSPWVTRKKFPCSIGKTLTRTHRTGYGQHADYVFGWKGDSLQKAMDANCNVNCPQLRSQSVQAANQCKQNQKVAEVIDGWLPHLPGQIAVTTS